MTTVKWVAATSGSYSFNTPANWQFNAVPGVADLALFNPSGSPLYGITGNATVGGIEVDHGEADIIGALTLSGALATDVIVTGGALVIDGSVQGPGAIQVTSGSQLEVGSIGALGGSSATITSGGSLLVFYGGTLNLTGSLNLNGGAFQALRKFNSSAPTIFTLGVPIVLTNTGTLDGDGGLSLNVTGPISGSGTLSVSFGNVILSGNNSYTGGTAISGGSAQLTFGANELPTTGTLTMSGFGSLVSTASQTINNNRVMTGGVEFSAATGQTLILSGLGDPNGWTFNEVAGTTLQFGINGNTGTVEWGIANSQLVTNTGTEPVEVVGGTLKAIDGGLSVLLSDVSATIVDAGATLDINGVNTPTPLISGGGHITNSAAMPATLIVTNGGNFTGVIDGNLALSLTGGTLVLSGANTYIGGTTILAGAALDLAGAGSITGNVVDNGILDWADTTASLTFSGNISGSGIFVQQNGGVTTTLSGVNSYTGGTQIAAGTLALSSALPGTGNLVLVGGELLSNISQTINNPRQMQFTVAFAAAHNQTLTLGNVNPWSLTETSGNNNTIYFGSPGQDGTVVWGTAGGSSINLPGGTYKVEVSAGTLKGLDASFSFLTGDDTQTIVDAGATYDLAGFASSVNNLQGAGTVTDSGAAATLFVAGGNFAGTIGGTVALSVSGSTELTLTGSNTYSGGTTVNIGSTLILGPGGTTGTAATITDNGTLDIRHSDVFQLSGLTGTGNLVVEGPGTTVMKAGSTFSGGALLAGGTLQTAVPVGSGAITFLNGSTATLQVVGGGALPNAVVNFANGDVIDFSSVVFNQLSYAGGVLTMKENGSTVDTLTVSTPYASPIFHFTADGQGGTQIELSPPRPTGLALSPGSDSGIQGDNVTDAKQPTIVGFGAVGDTVSLFDGVNFIGSGTVAANGQWSIVTNTPLSLGAHTLFAAQLDSFNNAGSSTAMPLSIVQSPAINDVNGDNMSDIVLQNDSGAVGVWEMNGLNVVATGAVSNPGPSWHVIGTGDFNADGKSDILLQNSDGTVGAWEMNGFNMIAAAVVANPGPSSHPIATGDFNGDGMSDIVLQSTDGTVNVWEMSGLNMIGSGVVANPGPSWHVVGTGDFFGNGLSDILLQNSDGTVGIWQMNGTNMVGAAVVQNPGPSWHAIGTGDINGDGKADILLQNDSGQVGFWEMNGFSMIAAGSPGNPGQAIHAIGSSDFNGDGLSDVLFQSTSGQVAVWQMNGLNIATSGIQFNPGTTWHVIP